MRLYPAGNLRELKKK